MNDSIDLLSKVLDCTALRQRVLANNLANANTPDFKRMDVEFKAVLDDALRSHGTGHAGDVKPKIVEDRQSPARGDGNSVSLQKEIGEMTENALLYEFAARAVGLKLGQLQKAIRGQ